MDFQKAKINNAVAWYLLNKEYVRHRLPLTTAGRTFGVTWLEALESYIDLYRNDSLSLYLAQAYIQYPLRSVRAVLHVKKQQSEGNNLTP